MNNALYSFVNAWFILILAALPFAVMAACDLYNGIRGYFRDKKLQKEIEDAGLR